MERLKQAMERARAERQLVIKPPSEPRGPGSVERVSFARKLTGRSDVRIHYTRTATVSLDSEVLRDGRILLAEGIEDVAAAYKVLRTHILQRMRANAWRTLAITSPGVGEGKTTTAINLAISLAREVNQTVLLVDLDLKRPALGRFFTAGGSLGISDYLTGETDLADILIHPGIERLVILPGRDPIIHSSEILSSPRAIQLVEELKSRYENRLILFDMPPLFAGDDVIAFLPYVDGVMLVVEDGKVSGDELRQSQELLGDKCLGIVVNKAEMAGGSVGYY